jgi:SRSO17 transposase
VGVARQYAGITGQVENCQTVVFMAYAMLTGAVGVGVPFAG